MYVDDVLALSHDSECIMKALAEFYRLKDGCSKPMQYLGAELKFSDGEQCWAISSPQYVIEAVRNIKLHLQLQGHVLRKFSHPMPSAYKPECDITPLLSPEDTNYYQRQLTILRWMVELGGVDIYINAALLLSFLTAPRQGHLEAIYYIYGYLKSHNRSNMIFDSCYVNWKSNDFPSYDWVDFYPDAKEDFPSSMPKPRGNAVQMNVFVDANHA